MTVIIEFNDDDRAVIIMALVFYAVQHDNGAAGAMCDALDKLAPTGEKPWREMIVEGRALWAATCDDESLIDVSHLFGQGLN
jgi:hypothetical protein